MNKSNRFDNTAGLVTRIVISMADVASLIPVSGQTGLDNTVVGLVARIMIPVSGVVASISYQGKYLRVCNFRILEFHRLSIIEMA